MIKIDDLKNWLHRKEFTQKDKLLIVLATFEHPCQIKEIKERAIAAGLKAINKWNPSKVLGRAEDLAIKIPEGWEITEAGKLYLRNLGVSQISSAASQVAVDLRAELTKIKNSNTRAFVDEAINCHEFGFHRSAVVMSWLAAVHILYAHVHANHLTDFNKEAKRVNSKWKTAKTTDDLGRMGEHDFLDRIAAISVIGKNVKTELVQCLDRSNSCGHPNSYRLRKTQ